MGKLGKVRGLLRKKVASIFRYGGVNRVLICVRNNRIMGSERLESIFFSGNFGNADAASSSFGEHNL